LDSRDSLDQQDKLGSQAGLETLVILELLGDLVSLDLLDNQEVLVLQVSV